MLSDLESELAAGGIGRRLAEELQPSVAGRVAAEAHAACVRIATTVNRAEALAPSDLRGC